MAREFSRRYPAQSADEGPLSEEDEKFISNWLGVKHGPDDQTRS